MKHMIRQRSWVLAWAVCVLGQFVVLPSARAVHVDDLYQSTVPVSDHSASALGSALNQALVQVLVKVTGDADVAAVSGLAPALGQPAQYVQQYTYEQSPPAAGSTAPPGLQLQVTFDPPAVNTLVQSVQLPLWGQERPLMIMWVGVNANDADRYIVGSQADPPHPGAQQALLQAAKARGLPALFPLFDLEDQGRVHFSDLAGGFLGTIVRASARYQANAVLAGVVQPLAGGQWQGRWWLAFHAHADHWTTQGSDRNTVLASGVDAVADRLAAWLAVGGAALPDQTEKHMQIVVAGVDGVGAYARIDRLLKHLAPIAAVRLLKVNGHRVTFSVLPRGTTSDVARNLSLVEWLAPASGPDSNTQAEPALSPLSMLTGSSLPDAATVSTPMAVRTPIAASAAVPMLYYRYQP